MSDHLVKKALEKKVREEDQYRMEQAWQWKQEDELFKNTTKDADIYENRHYSFLERQENEMNWSFGTGSEIKKEAEPATFGEWEVIQQEKELSKAEKNVVKQEKKIMERQKNLSILRNVINSEHDTRDDMIALAREEEKYFKDRIKLINLSAKADLEKATTEKDKLVIDINKKQAIVDAWTDYAKNFNIGSEMRDQTLKSKEDAQLDLYWAKYQLKLLETEPAQKKKAKAKYKRKVAEAYIKSVISQNDENCKEDHVIKTEINGKPVVLVNMGRAFLGGTKPTYYYKDMETGKQYLYKKAENCCGVQKPEGAIVTEIGAKIQHIVDPEHEIPAIGIKDANGKYIGSVQEIMDVKQKPDIDFDSWQLTSEANGGQNPEVVKNPEIQKTLLIFHCVDWLLCNFDTKGEHLLQRKDGSFVSIDKEGGMNQILKEGSQHMSCTFKPHNHEPIYNVFFRMYRDKKIDLDAGALKALDKKVRDLEAYSDEEYMKMFEPYIRQVNKKPKQMRENILKRKKNLRNEYNRFLSSLREGTKLPENA